VNNPYFKPDDEMLPVVHPHAFTSFSPLWWVTMGWVSFTLVRCICS
jgi:hypothetical protein